MRFVISLFLLVCVCGLTSVVNAYDVKCDYEDSSFEVPGSNLNMTYYTCVCKGISGFWKQENKLERIVGSHQSGKTDDDVKFVRIYLNQNLKTLTSVFCEKFRNLEAIWIFFAYVYVEDAFWKCQNLKHLKLSHNDFRQLPANLLAKNGKLETILISLNLKLSSLPENFFANQNQLEYLSLDRNSLSSLPSGIFKQLAGLKYRLDLNDNNLEVIEPKWFETLIKLEELKIQHNKFTEVPQKCFQTLRSLKELWLGMNKISTLHPDSFFGLDNLELLSFHENQLTDLPSGVFAELKKLKELSLASNRLTTIHSDSFGSLPKLQQIELYDNKINSIDEKIVDSTALKTISMTNNTCYSGRIKDDRSAIKSALKTCFANYRPQPGSCGRSSEVTSTVIGGSYITQGQFPWLAVLEQKKSGSYFCGGVLISNRKVLTAAHCLLDKRAVDTRPARSFVVSLGTHDLDSKNEPDRVNFAIQRINLHPDWNPDIEEYDADIAVLYLAKDVTFTKFIKPICLIPAGSPVESVKQGFVVGYGQSEHEDATEHENIGKVLKIPIVDQLECNEKYPLWADYSSLRTFCGGWANGTGACNGDSGGGLYVKYGDNFYLRGLVSSSLKGGEYGCRVDALSLYTDVPQFHDWIEKTKGNQYLFNRN